MFQQLLCFWCAQCWVLPSKKPSDTKCHPKAWALLFSFYHRTLLALATLLYLWQELLSKAPHCISNTSDSHSSIQGSHISLHARSCQLSKYFISLWPPLPPPSQTNSSTTSGCWENNILCIPQQPTHSKRLTKDIPNVPCCQRLCVRVAHVCIEILFHACLLYMLN